MAQHQRAPAMGMRRTRPFRIPAALLVCVIVVAFAVAERLDGGAGATSHFGVYLRPSSSDVHDAVDMSQIRLALEGRQFEAVASANDLERVVASDHPQSIWVHRSQLPSVSDEWLRQQLDNGTVIVGIDMPMSELATVLRVDGGSTPNWDPPGVSTYVIVGQALDVPYTNEVGEPAIRGRTTRVNDAFDPHDPWRLVMAVDIVISNVRETYGGSR